VCMSECDREASKMRGPWPTRDSCAMKRNMSSIDTVCKTCRFPFQILLSPSLGLEKYANDILFVTG
jgi:hypothetical protein